AERHEVVALADGRHQLTAPEDVSAVVGEEGAVAGGGVAHLDAEAARHRAPLAPRLHQHGVAGAEAGGGLGEVERAVPRVRVASVHGADERGGVCGRGVAGVVLRRGEGRGEQESEGKESAHRGERRGGARAQLEWSWMVSQRVPFQAQTVENHPLASSSPPPVSTKRPVTRACSEPSGVTAICSKRSCWMGWPSRQKCCASSARVWSRPVTGPFPVMNRAESA